MNQRWRDRLNKFVDPSGIIRTADYEVAPILLDAPAKAFVTTHHYSGTYPAARHRFGLYHRAGALVGVAVFSHPCNNKVLTSVFPGDPLDAVELGRFVLLDSVKGNGETWFLARCFEQLRVEGLRGVVSFSDPTPRTALEKSDGNLAESEGNSVIFPGHIGTIYQAHNAQYLGRSTPRRLRLLPDGSVLSDRAIQKIRNGERGWRYAATQLERAGAWPCVGGDRRAWLWTWLPRVTRRLDHPGNHRYAWPLNRRVQVAMARQPYPKRVAA